MKNKKTKQRYASKVSLTRLSIARMSSMEDNKKICKESVIVAKKDEGAKSNKLTISEWKNARSECLIIMGGVRNCDGKVQLWFVRIVWIGLFGRREGASSTLCNDAESCCSILLKVYGYTRCLFWLLTWGRGCREESDEIGEGVHDTTQFDSNTNSAKAEVKFWVLWLRSSSCLEG